MPPIGFRLLALASALSAWALVAVGDVVRVTESGLGCPDWPLCEGGVVPGERRAPVIEYSHRATAAVVAILVVATALRALRRRGPLLAGVLPAAAAAAQVPIGIALVLTSDRSDAHSALEMLHVAGAGAVWASLVGLATAVGRAPLRGARAGSQARPAPAALS
ncbi:COX15/CtaA family protein [Gaiella occulta]|uniref:COX15/CtaA family protein n=1 Tax=Gaiella occulta TaxID=1002870 RepID=UPI0015F045AD|nr:COX15/CtaA family protein [Gaiella occulta]